MNGSLNKLHDFYQPPPAAWTPQTAGWYVVFSVIGLLILWFAARTVRRWIANRYRRAALRELATVAPQQYSTLLKRTALAAWPRDKVASLNGPAWLKFLDETSGESQFLRSPGNQIEEIGLRPVTLSADTEQALRTLAAKWIRRHRVQA
jgi:Domain of unknown function (DUF4381)